MYGEKAGVKGESAGYVLVQLAPISPGLDELGLASVDIQFVTPCCPYSYGRPVALDGTARDSVTGTTKTHIGTGDQKPTLSARRVTIAPRRLHGRRHALDGRHRQVGVGRLAVHVGRNSRLQSGRRGG